MAFLSLFLFLTWDNALENDDHHTSIYLQLNDYNSILEQSMTLDSSQSRYTAGGIHIESYLVLVSSCNIEL